MTANVTANNPEEARQAPKLWGFFDGSGTHSGARVCTVAGLAGEYAAFEALDARWKHVLQDPTWPSRLAEFHTVECVNQTGKFKGWSYAERLAILGRLVSAIVETPGLLAIGSSLLCDDLLTMPKQDLELLKAQGLGTPTDLCFQHLLQRIINRTREYGEREQIGLVFDDEPTEGERYYALFNHYQAGYPVRGHIVGIGFSDSAAITPLQAADLVAYTTMRWLAEGAYPETRDPWFPIVPAFLRMIEAIHADGGGYDREALSELIDKVKRGETAR